MSKIPFLAESEIDKFSKPNKKIARISWKLKARKFEKGKIQTHRKHLVGIERLCA